jgi:hypothetical protein
MMIDRERHDIDWSRLTPAQAEIVRVFAAALREVREMESDLLRLNLRKVELYADGLAQLNAELASRDSAFWREVEQRIGHAPCCRPSVDQL